MFLPKWIYTSFMMQTCPYVTLKLPSQRRTTCKKPVQHIVVVIIVVVVAVKHEIIYMFLQVWVSKQLILEELYMGSSFRQQAGLSTYWICCWIKFAAGIKQLASPACITATCLIPAANSIQQQIQHVDKPAYTGFFLTRTKCWAQDFLNQYF